MSNFAHFDTGTRADDWAATSSGQTVATVATVAPRIDVPLSTAIADAQLARAGIHEMGYIARPAAFEFRAWAVLLADLKDFADSGLDAALKLGWPLIDLFGVPRDPSNRRVDCVGLLPLLRGRPVRIINGNRAEITNRIGPHNTFYRHAPGCSHPFERLGAALIWNVYLKDIAS